MRARRTTLGAAAVLLVLASASPVAAAPAGDFELPFPCGQAWTGTTRSNHSPSVYAVDWNRPDDVGDPVVASVAGTVSRAVTNSTTGYGNLVVLDHAGGEQSYYAHLAAVTVVVGQRVDQGAQLGSVGSTGNSSAPHLHYEQRVDRSVVHPWFHQAKYAFGTSLTSQNCVDVPLAGDWDGDGVAEPTVFRRQLRAQFRLLRADGTMGVRWFGSSVDDPVLGDWDGNGTIDPGARSPLTRYFRLQRPTGVQELRFGLRGDKPVAGNFAGGPAWEVGVWRASRASFILRLPGQPHLWVTLGDADDLPVTGDWDGDGITDLGVYDQLTSTFTLRRVDVDGTAWLATVQFGSPGDLPVAGDWDGNGRTDLGTWTPSTAVLGKRVASSPTAATRSVTTVRIGRRR